MNVKQAETVLENYIAKAKEKGFTIERGGTCDYSVRECCALGAVKVVESTEDTIFGFRMAGKFIGMNDNQIDSFVDGFDGMPVRKGIESRVESYFNLGRKIARKHVDNRSK